MRLKVLTQKYPCNGCTVCCTVMAVEPLGKPFYARCVNELKDGCGIYEDRPQECRDFICSFAAGLMGDATTWRPDQCGLLFFLRRFSDGLWLEIFEAVAGAAADARRSIILSDGSSPKSKRRRRSLERGCTIRAIKSDSVLLPTRRITLAARRPAER